MTYRSDDALYALSWRSPDELATTRLQLEQLATSGWLPRVQHYYAIAPVTFNLLLNLAYDEARFRIARALVSARV